MLAYQRPKRWLPWVLDPKLATLEHEGYQVDLEKMVDSARTLDAIFSAAARSATPEELAGLIRAIGDILRPQATMCSGGQNIVSTPAQVMVRVRAAADEYHVD